MSNWSSSYEKRRDGFNIVAAITYTDGETTITEQFSGVDLTEAAIAEQARKRIRNVLEVGDAALIALQSGPITIPDAPVTDEKAQAVAAANLALSTAVRNAQFKALADPHVDAALAALDAAQTALAQSAQTATIEG